MSSSSIPSSSSSFSSSTSRVGSAEEPLRIDLREIYSNNKITMGTPSGAVKDYVICVPRSLIIELEGEIPAQLELTEEEFRRLQMPLVERKRQIRKEHSGCRVFFVSPNPNEKGRLFIEGVSGEKAFKLFGKTVTSLLENLGVSNPFESAVQKQKRSKRTTQVSAFSGNVTHPLALDPLAGSLGLHELMEQDLEGAFQATKKIDQFTRSVANTFQRFGMALSPNEPVRIMWDMMAQGVISRFPFESEQERSDIRQRLLRYFENVNWFFTELIDKALLQDPQAGLFLLLCVNTLKNLNGIISEEKYVPLLEQLQEVQAPFLELLNDYITQKDGKAVFDETKKGALSLMSATYQRIYVNKAHQITGIQMSVRTTQTNMKMWFESRTRVLIEYLNASSLNAPWIEQCKDLGFQIIDQVRQKGWRSVYQLIQQLHAIVREKTKEIRKEKTIEVRKEGILEEKKLSQAYTLRSDFPIARYLQFTRALVEDLEHIILNSSTTSAVSHLAIADMQIAFQGMQQPLSEVKKEPEFASWMQTIKKEASKASLDQLAQFQELLKSLGAVRQEIIGWQTLQTAVEGFAEMDRLQDYHEFLDIYQIVLDNLSGPIARWKMLLEQINAIVPELQAMFAASLFLPSASDESLDLLKVKFSRMNHRLSELIKPVSNFICAFEELICMADKSYKSVYGSRPASNPKALSLNLFQDDLGALEINWRQHRQQLVQEEPMVIAEEVQEVIALPSSSSAFTGTSSSASSSSSSEEDPLEMAEKLMEEAFLETKTRKRRKNIVRVFEHYGIQVSITPSGQGGSHMLLKTGSGTFPLPNHTEWKPGLGRAIEKQLLEELQKIIGRP